MPAGSTTIDIPQTSSGETNQAVSATSDSMRQEDQETPTPGAERQSARNLLKGAMMEAIETPSQESNKAIAEPLTERSNNATKAFDYWLTGSRIRMLFIWLPLQVASVAFVSYIIFRNSTGGPGAPAKEWSGDLANNGLLITSYFVFIVLKDSAIWLYFFLYDPFHCFWNGLVTHLMSLTIDIMVLLALTIWGTVLVSQPEQEECLIDTICENFLDQLYLNVSLGYAYILFSLFLKPVVLTLFCLNWGFRWMKNDELEEQEWKVAKMRDQIITSLRADTYESIFGPQGRPTIFSGSENTFADPREKCPICLQSIAFNERITVLNCSEDHLGHTECIYDHLSYNLHCPVCNTSQEIALAKKINASLR